jgi:hypothetical protein
MHDPPDSPPAETTTPLKPERRKVAQMPPVPKARKGAGRVMTTVRYDDGRTESYDLDRPIYLLEASELLELGPEDMTNPIRLTYWLAWVAAGHPGVNGDASADDARAAARDWLRNGGVAEIDVPNAAAADAAVPPTRTASRGASRG